MKTFAQFLEEKKSPYKKETLDSYRKKYEEGEDIPFGVKTSLIAQGLIPHEGGPYKGKKKKTEIYEAVAGTVDPTIDVNQIVYGNPPMEIFQLAQKVDDPIKNWFIENGIAEKIKSQAPANDSEITKNDLQLLMEMTSNATAEEITFARHVDKIDNLAQAFIDLLAEHGHEEDMGSFFRVDSQTESILHFLKDIIDRPRPYQLARAYNLPLYPLIRTDAMTSAYPSGHSLTAYVISEHYSRKFPEISSEIKELGEKIARSREVTGIHYPSDTQISREIANIIWTNNLISK
jgi:hypothetical protein